MNFTDLYEKIISGEEKISLVGLGYVGMPIAVAFAKKVGVIGYDLNAKKVELYKNGMDPTCEVGDDAIKASTVEFTNCLVNSSNLARVKLVLICTGSPFELTPINGKLISVLVIPLNSFLAFSAASLTR